MRRFSYLLLGFLGLLGCACSSHQLIQPQASERFLQSLNAPTVSQAALDSSANLMDILSYAALHNPALKAAYYRWLSAAYQIPQAVALPDPQLSYTYFIESVETRVGPQRQKFAFRQSFPWFGKLRLKGRVASKAADVKAADFDAQRLKLFYEVKKQWFEYAFQQRSIEIYREHLQLLKLLEQTMLTHYRTGETSQISLLSIQMERDRLSSELNDQRDRLKPQIAALNTLLNRPINAVLPNPQSLPFPTIQLTDSLLSQLAISKNPSVQALRHAFEREESGIALAQKGYFPSITLGFDYIDTKTSPFPAVLDSGKDPLMVTVSLNLPIWFKQHKAAINAAKAKHRSAVYQLQSLQNNQLSKLNNLLYQFRASRRKIDLYRDSLLPRAKQVLEVARTGFTNGKVDFKTLIDTQRTLLDYALTLERNKATGYQQLAALEQLCGQEFPVEVISND